MKRILGLSVLALMLGAAAAPAAEVFIRIGPPRPPREVVVVRPGPNYVWIPGYYRWSGERYIWVAGRREMPPRPHAHWVPGHWHHHHRGYVWVEGYWR
jgi:hypothetical protein